MQVKKVRSKVSAVVLALCSALPALVAAENHALIMWIGDYADQTNNLPGIDIDAKRARQIASYMGVASENVIEYANSQLTLEGMHKAVRQLTGRIRDGDKVMIYYSGHGGQVESTSGTAGCTQGLVAHDGRMYFDKALRTDLDELAKKASQVVMFNDSCFSGGAIGKNIPDSVRGLTKAKFFKGKPIAGERSGELSCGQAINKLSRNLEAVAAERGTQMLYVAASAENEVSFANGSAGSIGTRAWEACLSSSSDADADRNGFIDGAELQNCSRRFVDRERFRQTVTVLGNPRLLVSFAVGQANASAQPPVSAAQVPSTVVNPGPSIASAATQMLGASPPAPVNAAATLETIRASADTSYAIQLTPSKNTLKIKEDNLDFTVSTNRGGYLYLLHIGSDGKTFDVLFPNKIDGDNWISPGTHRYPRPKWAVKAFGPVGTGYMMAYISDTPKEMTKEMVSSGVFSSSPANVKSTRNLGVVMMGAEAGASGRFGTSAVVPIQEVN